MIEVAPYDLGPLFQLLLLGGLLGLLPLAWVWHKSRHSGPAQRMKTLAWVTVFLTFDLILFGAFTRLTDSGLGCPDWPGCYGSASPMGAREAISAAETAMPTGPVTWGKAWIEMIHRYLASAVGFLIVVMVWQSWRQRVTLRLSMALPLLSLFWVCLQGAFGALTVTMKLFPAIVTLHLLGGLGLLALLRLQSVSYANAAAEPLAPLSQGTRRLAWWIFALVWLQIAMGGWVSTNYAVLACTDFPTCQGSWWPQMDFKNGFTLWRELGHGAGGEMLTMAALTAIHYSHRLMAYVVLLALFALAWLWRSRPDLPGKALLLLALWQLITGLSNVVLQWPLVAAVAHTGGAAGLVFVLTGVLARPQAVRWAAEPPSAGVVRAVSP